MKITKKNLTEKIYKKYLKTYPAVKQIRKQDVQAIVDIFVQTMAEDLLQGNSIELRGFGIFERKIQKARTWAKDPRNGNYLDCFDHYKASFRQGEKLKNSMKEIPVQKV